MYVHVIITLAGVIIGIIAFVLGRPENGGQLSQLVLVFEVAVLTAICNAMPLGYRLWKRFDAVDNWVDFLNEQSGFDFLRSLYALRKEITKPGARASGAIALKQLRRAVESVKAAETGKDFTLRDIVGANSELFASLKEGDKFLGVSALTDPVIWLGNEETPGYLHINLEAVKRGLKIQRIFVFDSTEQKEEMRFVLDKLQKSTEVRSCFRSQLSTKHFCPDISLVMKRRTAVYVEKDTKIPKVIISSDQATLTKLIGQYEFLWDEIGRLSQ